MIYQVPVSVKKCYSVPGKAPKKRLMDSSTSDLESSSDSDSSSDEMRKTHKKKTQKKKKKCRESVPQFGKRGNFHLDDSCPDL